MVGRGAEGRPWQLALISHALYGTPKPNTPIGSDFTDMVCRHYESMMSFYGTTLGNRVARKHLGWYMDEISAPIAMRKRVLTERDASRVLELLQSEFVTDYSEVAA